MGTVSRWRAAAGLLLVAATLPMPGATAATATYERPFQPGPQGGDEFNYIEADPASGTITIVRIHPVPLNDHLGCPGYGGFANFEVAHAATTPVKTVTVSYASALVDPYAWISLSIRQGSGFITSTVLRGPLVGDGEVSLAVPAGVTGPVTIWFGMQVASACPNVDGGHATFTSVAVSDS